MKIKTDLPYYWPIYYLLAHNCQSRRVAQIGYWYLDRNNQPTKQKLSNLEDTREKVLKIAKRIKLLRQLEKFDCPQGEGGCHFCSPMEKILTGKASLVGVNDFGQNVYILKKLVSEDLAESEVL